MVYICSLILIFYFLGINMSRYLLLNFEDFGLSQDITKMIQPFNPFCICCLGREGPLFDLDKCQHSEYLEYINKPQLKQFNQLVCLQCHRILKKIKCFQQQIEESYDILSSGTYNNSTINKKRLQNLTIQKVVDVIYLPSEIEHNNDISKDISNSQDIYENQNLLKETFTDDHSSDIERNKRNKPINIRHKEQIYIKEPFEDESSSDIEKNKANMTTETSIKDICKVSVESNTNFKKRLQNCDTEIEMLPQNSMTLDDLSLDMSKSNIETNFTDQPMQDQIKLQKNIKTALEILERNNQSFVMLGSQLQFLNGEHLSFLETSLLNKEILTDIPLVPTKTKSTDLDNGLLNNAKPLDIELDEPDKMFYDNIHLSPDLLGKEMNSDNIDGKMDMSGLKASEPKTSTAKKKKKERKTLKNNTPIQIKTVKLSQEELNRERVMEAQSSDYLKYKFRCETCIIGFNYKENLEDHLKRKHGSKEADNITCDICSQIIPNPGSVTEHNYRHYTRYECLLCNKKHHTYNEATRHFVRNHSNGGSLAENNKKKNKRLKES